MVQRGKGRILITVRSRASFPAASRPSTTPARHSSTHSPSRFATSRRTRASRSRASCPARRTPSFSSGRTCWTLSWAYRRRMTRPMWPNRASRPCWPAKATWSAAGKTSFMPPWPTSRLRLYWPSSIARRRIQAATEADAIRAQGCRKPQASALFLQGQSSARRRRTSAPVLPSRRQRPGRRTQEPRRRRTFDRCGRQPWSR